MSHNFTNNIIINDKYICTTCIFCGVRNDVSDLPNVCQKAPQPLASVSLSDASIDAIVHRVLNHVKDAPHYMRMCERVVNHVFNKRNIVENYHQMDYKDGEMFVDRVMSTEDPFRLVIPSAVAASNVYHLLKALNDEVPTWINYLSRFGIPQLVEMVGTGSTPKFDGTGYHPDGLEPL